MPSERSHHRSDSELLAAAAAAAARADDLDDGLAQLLGLASEYLGATAGAIYILDGDRDVLEVGVTAGLADPEAAEVAAVSESHDPIAEAVKLRQIRPIEDAGHVAALRGCKTAYLLPLIVRRDCIEVALGAMALGFERDLPDAEAMSRAEPLADLAAVAVERGLTLSLGSEKAEWFSRLAHIDPLTGLANRKTTERILELEVARAGRQGQNLSVALFAVDRYDEIQRTGGNGAADQALRRVAQTLADSVRFVDTIARFEADQFLLIAPGPDGMVVTERLVRGIAALPPVEGRVITVSAGLASFPMDGRTPEDLLEVATTAMVSARAAGGGRVMQQPPVKPN